jgi:hypothetical protein
LGAFITLSCAKALATIVVANNKNSSCFISQLVYVTG